MLLMIDNYDSFVYNLMRYFAELDQEVMIVRNDKITLEEIEKIKPSGIIISPGPKSPKDAGISLEILEKFKGEIPILGICLGHQCIGHYFGSQVVKGEKPVHGKISYIKHNGSGVFKEIKNPLRVTRYHSLVVDSKMLGEDLEVTAETEDGVIMGLRHKQYEIHGVQFHPEAEMTEEGHALLNNFIKITKDINNNDN